MRRQFYFLVAVLLFINCKAQKEVSVKIISNDVTNFWNAYDKIQTTKDTIQQMKYLKEFFLDKGTPGLKGMMTAKGCTGRDYLMAINNYPKFWNSVRKNTLKAEVYEKSLAKGVEKLRNLYPKLKPAEIYFTMSPLRSNGTTIGNKVLIGSELAMTDINTETSEFKGRSKKGRRTFFDSNPINDLILLNVHEYVHTQQNAAPDNLLCYVLREGVAEFVSVKAMGVPSAAPAIAYGKKNDKVREKFEEEVFYGGNVYKWLWSDAPNEFGVRDLGYYIGYAICERYYEQAVDKKAAIEKMIGLDFSDEMEILDFVNSTNFFSDSLENLYKKFEVKRPTVIRVKPFEKKSQYVKTTINQITIEFSEPMQENVRSFDYGPLGKDSSLYIKKFISRSEDGKSFTFEIVALKPNKRYQLLIGNGFRNLKGIPLKSYLIDFKTKK